MKKIFKKIKPYLWVAEMNLFVIGVFLAATLIDTLIVGTVFFVHDPMSFITPARAEWNITVPREQKLEAKSYILNEAKKANLDLKKVDCLIDNESDYRNTWNVNNNGSVDFGIWMINSIHIKSGSLTMECAVDLACSTSWSIQKLKEGRWEMWYGYTNNCK